MKYRNVLFEPTPDGVKGMAVIVEICSEDARCVYHISSYTTRSVQDNVFFNQNTYVTDTPFAVAEE